MKMQHDFVSTTSKKDHFKNCSLLLTDLPLNLKVNSIYRKMAVTQDYLQGLM